MNWIKEAACRGMDTAVFYPQHGESKLVKQAKAICRSCPVVLDCAEWAIDHCEMHGIWGGLSHRERQAIRSERGNASCTSAR